MIIRLLGFLISTQVSANFILLFFRNWTVRTFKFIVKDSVIILMSVASMIISFYSSQYAFILYPTPSLSLPPSLPSRRVLSVLLVLSKNECCLSFLRACCFNFTHFFLMLFFSIYFLLLYLGLLHSSLPTFVSCMFNSLTLGLSSMLMEILKMMDFALISTLAAFHKL